MTSDGCNKESCILLKRFSACKANISQAKAEILKLKKVVKKAKKEIRTYQRKYPECDCIFSPVEQIKKLTRAYHMMPEGVRGCGYGEMSFKKAAKRIEADGKTTSDYIFCLVVAFTTWKEDCVNKHTGVARDGNVFVIPTWR